MGVGGNLWRCDYRIHHGEVGRWALSGLGFVIAAIGGALYLIMQWIGLAGGCMMKTRRYLCDKCGGPPYEVTYPRKTAKYEVCPECGGLMRRLPLRIRDYIHPMKGAGK